KPGVKWFNRFLKDYGLIPKYLRKMGAIYAMVVHEAKNMAHAYTIAGEALRHNPDNHASPFSIEGYQQNQYNKNTSGPLYWRLMKFKRVMCGKTKPLYCSKMVYLKLAGLKISDALISAILHSCPNICFLILDKSKGFTNIPIIEIARYCPKLLHLSLNLCICLTNRCITEITRSCPKLKHLELGDCSISNKAVEKITQNCANLKYLSLKGCRRISKEVMKKFNPKIKIEYPDYSDDKWSSSNLPLPIPIFISTLLDETDFTSIFKTLVEGKIPVKALIDTTSKFNTISKSLFDKLEEDYGIRDRAENLYGGVVGVPVKNLYRDVIGEIKGLDLQFCYKGKWQSLDCTELIDFQIRKNPSFDLVLGQDWLWMREAKIIFGHSLVNCKRYAKIIIDGMSIPLIEENSRPFGGVSLSHKASSTKNNLSNSMDLKPDLDELVDMFKKLSLRSKDNISDSIDSSLSRLRSDVINMHKTASAKKRSIRKCKVKGKINY
ncbi:42295_t:CDS:2, partial [Gigaspora margarita]